MYQRTHFTSHAHTTAKSHAHSLDEQEELGHDALVELAELADSVSLWIVHHFDAILG